MYIMAYGDTSSSTE